MRRRDISFNAIGAALRRFVGNILAPCLYCVYVLQLLAIIIAEAIRDGFALFFYFAIHSLRPFHLIRTVHAAHGRFCAQQVDKAKQYLLERQEATKSRFCYLSQRSCETTERLISESLDGDWFHRVLGGLPLIETQKMPPEQKASEPRPATTQEPASLKTARIPSVSRKDKFPRIFALVQPAASAPLPPQNKIAKKSFRLARAVTPASTRVTNASSTSSKKSIVSLSDLRNPWADQKKPLGKSLSGSSLRESSLEALQTAPSGSTQPNVPEKIVDGKLTVPALSAQVSIAKPALTGRSIRSKIIEFEATPPDLPPPFPDR